MTTLILPEDWRPIGIQQLEPRAWEIVRSDKQHSVIAGPGAGKTELLAQRADYLLRTGLCPEPQRILAISFKKDAAKNLRDRVVLRTSIEQAHRFDSLTFDAFAKGLLDRFLTVLPSDIAVRNDYEIIFPNKKDFSFFLNSLRAIPSSIGTIADLQAIPRDPFEKCHILGQPLTPQGVQAVDAPSWAARCWWDSCLHSGPKPKVTFPMIGRLVEILLRENPQICAALRLTYSHVFMDEFQDTTHVQYDLAKTAFHGSKAIITAVGDNKQRIMRWAMAMDDTFGQFELDFQAERVRLISNYRSSIELVAMQHHLAQRIDPQTDRAQSMMEQQVGQSEGCEIWEFLTPESEAQTLARVINQHLQGDQKLKPRDFVLLVRQKPQDYAPRIKTALYEKGIACRVEVDLQDLLAERLTGVLMPFLRLGSTSHGGKQWSLCCQITSMLWGIDPHSPHGFHDVQNDIDRFGNVLRGLMSIHPASVGRILQILQQIIDFVGRDHIKAIYPEYRQGSWFNSLTSQMADFLAASCKTTANWKQTLDDFEGLNALPMMTIHKSKGLEYHTVFFVALDDQAWWNFMKDPGEERSAFFVAFSRAKQRVVFTYCRNRANREGISELYEILQAAGVKSKQFG